MFLGKLDQPAIRADYCSGSDYGLEGFEGVFCFLRDSFESVNDMNTELSGVVHGNSIELFEAPGLPDGQRVIVTLKPAKDSDQLAPGEGIRRSAGSWDDDPEGLDAYLEWNRRQRKAGRTPLEP